MSETFASVVDEWRQADPYRIHPAREHESEDAYWESGVVQAEEAAAWVPAGGTILDFGCGDGRVALPLSLFGYRVTCVDSNEAFLARLITNQNERGGRIRQTILSDGLDLPQRVDEPVDAVMCRAVFIHHSHADVELLVNSLVQVIKPGGLLICDWPLGPHHERRDWIDVTTWTREHRSKVARAAGLELVQDGKPSVWRKR